MNLSKVFIGGLILLNAKIAISGEQSQSPVAVPLELKTRLNATAFLPNFGNISYRPPKAGNNGTVVVLFHGVYGGASHLSFRKMIDALDNRGAQVFAMDLPGTGQSDYHEYANGKKGSIRKRYTAQTLESFVVEFTRIVVKQPAILVGQATIAMPVLGASKRLGDLAKSVVLLSPSGVRVLSETPTLQQRLFGQYLRLFEHKLNDFYLNQLLIDENIYGSVASGIYDKQLVDETFLTEFKLGRNYLDQKWISLSFVEGRLSYRFDEAGRGVTKPVLMIFGKEDVGIAISDGAGNINNFEPDREADFATIRPDFKYLTLPNTASILWEEKADLVSEQILNF